MLPELIVFLSNAGIMSLELIAGRMAAPYLGMSLYTWTAVIGVVLAGIGLGNYLGGRLADRYASRHFFGGVLMLAGLTSMAILSIDVLDRFLTMDSLTLSDLPLVSALAAYGIVLFFVPCTILGSISPVVAKLAIRDLSRSGETIGRIYAAGTAGSIVGTFATGFWLISAVGTHAVVWAIAWNLLIFGMLFFVRSRWLWAASSLVLVISASFSATRLGWLEGPCTRETNYFCIKVEEEEIGGDPVRVLVLDRLIHSYSSLNDPTKLVYGYEKVYAEITDYLAQRSNPLSALFIGGGGYTFPRYMEALYPSSDLRVIEIDPGVTEIAYEMFGLSRDSKITSYNEDARMFLEREPSASFDLIFGDAFNDYSVPYHLTTKEFNDRVRAWLADDGLYVVNIIDGPFGRFLRAYTYTLRQTFQHVYLVFDVASWRRASRSTIVIVASDAPLDVSLLAKAAPTVSDQLVAGQQIDELLAEGRTALLSDRYAPVDQMLLPVFLQQVRR